MAKIVRCGCWQKLANCFYQGFKCFCMSYFKKNKNHQAAQSAWKD